jgi:hypothetical protein
VHAEPLHGQRVGFGKSAHAHQRRCHREVCFFDKRLQFPVRIGRDDTATSIKHRPFRLGDHREELFQRIVRRVLCGIRVGAAEVDRRGINRLEFFLLNILRDIDDHRTRPAAAGEVERFLEDAWQLGHVDHQIRVFHDRQRHPIEVRFLKRHLADVLRENLAGNCDQRNRVHERVRNRRYEIGRAGSAGCHADADLSRCPRITLRGK